MTALYVALGGALGSLARYGLGSWIQVKTGAGFPWGTFAVNGIGSLLIGLALGWILAVDPGPGVRAFIVVGLLGGFTTFSAFSYELVALLQSGEWWRTLAYATGSVVVGVFAAWIGLRIAGAFV